VLRASERTGLADSIAAAIVFFGDGIRKKTQALAGFSAHKYPVLPVGARVFKFHSSLSLVDTAV